MTRELDPTASLSACFGFELRRYRLEAGMSQETLGRKCLVSGSQVRMIEHAERKPDLAFTRYADQALGTRGALERLWWHANRESHPWYFHAYAVLERQATTLRAFDALAVSGLLQTEEYARALLRTTRPDYTAEQVEEFVSARMERQAILAREEPPLLLVVMGEDVLTHTVGGTRVMYEQLGYLAEMAQRSRIVIQIMPYGAGAHAGLGGTFVIASFLEGRDVVYHETASTGQLVEKPSEVMGCTIAYDVLRAEALSREASLDRIRNAQGKYSHASQVAQGQP